jgi:hypothetical protein
MQGQIITKLKNKSNVLLVIIILFVFYGWYKSSQNEIVDISCQETNQDIKVQFKDLLEFPPLDIPLVYFDEKDESMSNNTSYHIFKNEEAYHSYPTTTITLEYSNIPKPLPPIKTDNEIHGVDSNSDWMGYTKSENIKKYGELARRFVGIAGDGLIINSVKHIDLNNDNETETLVSLSLMGANVGGTQDILIKGDIIIFSTSLGSFSSLIPAKNGNGFTINWYDNFKGLNGYVTTRFVFDGEKYIPIYEQKTRYIRIKK